MATSFHKGELLMQEKAGTRGVAEELRLGLDVRIDVEFGRNKMLGELRAVYVAAKDREGRLWVSEVSGEGGFFQASSEKKLNLELGSQAFAEGDPIKAIIADKFESPVSVLALNFDKRRRYRTNGVISVGESDSSRLVMDVAEAFPNCPKYIQRREIVTVRDRGSEAPDVRNELSEEVREIVQKADTMLFASINPEVSTDINQRGGNPGFVRVASSTELFWPEYRGNGMFQSSGNLEVDSHAGLLFIDYENAGDIVQITGEAKSDWTADELEGTGRAIRFSVKEVRHYRAGSPYIWKLNGLSDYNPIIAGTESSRDPSKPFPVTVKLVKIVEESASVKTFRFLAPKPIKFLPGQYASFDFDIPSIGKLTRTWTLSETANSPRGDVTLEISVKRKDGGVMSNWLHDNAQIGLEVTLTGVGGDLSPLLDMDNVPKKIALISGGIGITPMMAIVRGLGAFNQSSDVVFLHSERHEADRPFKNELSRRARNNPSLILINTVTDPEETPAEGVIPGRLTKELVEPAFGADIQPWQVYLCGPNRFINDMSQTLIGMGLPPLNLHSEEFNF